MKLAKVVGTVTATVHERSYDGQTLLLCVPVAGDGTPAGEVFIAVDRAQAGEGDTVLVNAEGGGARQVFGMKPTDRLAIQDVIVGVVDAVTER
ncbi:MAG: EutN/CcmL family microcompartment protein [Polyangiales bacterium]